MFVVFAAGARTVKIFHFALLWYQKRLNLTIFPFPFPSFVLFSLPLSLPFLPLPRRLQARVYKRTPVLLIWDSTPSKTFLRLAIKRTAFAIIHCVWQQTQSNISVSFYHIINCFFLFVPLVSSSEEITKPGRCQENWMLFFRFTAIWYAYLANAGQRIPFLIAVTWP